MSKANKANKEWVAKSVDVDPDQWTWVKVAAAVLDMNVRDWLDGAIAAELAKQKMKVAR